jgi:hypothetical protein
LGSGGRGLKEAFICCGGIYFGFFQKSERRRREKRTTIPEL